MAKYDITMKKAVAEVLAGYMVRVIVYKRLNERASILELLGRIVDMLDPKDVVEILRHYGVFVMRGLAKHASAR